MEQILWASMATTSGRGGTCTPLAVPLPRARGRIGGARRRQLLHVLGFRLPGDLVGGELGVAPALAGSGRRRPGAEARRGIGRPRRCACSGAALRLRLYCSSIVRVLYPGGAAPLPLCCWRAPRRRWRAERSARQADATPRCEERCLFSTLHISHAAQPEPGRALAPPHRSMARARPPAATKSQLRSACMSGRKAPSRAARAASVRMPGHTKRPVVASKATLSAATCWASRLSQPARCGSCTWRALCKWPAYGCCTSGPRARYRCCTGKMLVLDWYCTGTVLVR